MNTVFGLEVICRRMNTTEQESFRKVGEGTCLEILKSSVKSNLDLEDRMSKMLKVTYSKPHILPSGLCNAMHRGRSQLLHNCTQF